MRFSRAATLLPAALFLAACADEEPVVETPPRQLSESPFEYPEELWDAGVEGRTVLRIHINAQGAVDSVVVDTASGYPAFDSAAVAGTAALRFEPARRGPEAVASWFLLPVDFALAPVDTAAGTGSSTAPDTATNGTQ